ncbi:MAG: ABC transporter permease [SAR202 cluster bacterium]|nr:ABC transporter permease [SAR202 cluster bacterium]
MSAPIADLNRRPNLFGRIVKTLLNFWRVAPLSFLGGCLLAILFFVAIFGNFLAPESHTLTDYKRIREPPTLNRPLGSDHLGRDALSRIIIGSRTSLFIAFAAVFLAKLIGVTWGTVSGYRGGKFDLLSQRFLDVLMAIPTVIFALLLLAAIGSGVLGVIVAITVGSIAGTTRIVRAVVLSVKEMEFVTAAESLGASPLRIMLRHVAPQTVAPILVIVSASLGGAIFAESALSFLGLGIPPPNPSWGAMLGGTLAEAFKPPWWMVFYPGLAITLTILSFNLFGDGLRDTLDPRLRGRLD